MFDFVIHFFCWFYACVNVMGIVFSLCMAYWCIKGYIEIHFPDDDGQGDSV